MKLMLPHCAFWYSVGKDLALFYFHLSVILLIASPYSQAVCFLICFKLN